MSNSKRLCLDKDLKERIKDLKIKIIYEESVITIPFKKTIKNLYWKEKKRILI